MLSRLFGSSSSPIKNVRTATTTAGGTNTAATLTLTAPQAYQRHVIHNVQWGYDGTPTAGALIIQAPGTVFSVPVTAGGPGGFNMGFPGSPGVATTISLGAAGNVTGRLNVQYTIEAE